MLPGHRGSRCKGVKKERTVCRLEDPSATGILSPRELARPISRMWEFRVSRLKISILAFAILTISGALAAAQDEPDPLADLPPQGSVKLSQLVAETEGRPGFYAIEHFLLRRGIRGRVLYAGRSRSEAEFRRQDRQGSAAQGRTVWRMTKTGGQLVQCPSTISGES